MNHAARWLDLRETKTSFPPTGSASRCRGHIEGLTTQIVNAFRSDDPTRMLRCFLDPIERTWLLERFWNAACQQHGPVQQAGFSIADLRTHTGHLCGRPTVIIELPEPNFHGEGFFVAARYVGIDSTRGFTATGTQVFSLERSSETRRIGSLVERVGGRALTRATNVDASLFGFARKLRLFCAGEMPPSSERVPENPFHQRARLLPHELKIFARDLRSLHVADADSGVIVALSKATTDSWLCTVGSDSGKQSSKWLPPLDSSRPATDRFIIGLNEVIESLTSRVTRSNHRVLPSTEVGQQCET